jgi:hypothetical protein
MADLVQALAGACAVPSRPYLSTLTPFRQREKRATGNHEQIHEFCQFLAHEWKGNRQHSYAVFQRKIAGMVPYG